MELYQIDDEGRLFVSAAITAWSALEPHLVDVVIDLEGGLDLCIPTQTNQCLYVYFPFEDDDQTLPDLNKLRAVARLGASLVRGGHTVLSHCTSGFNRSALVAGLILTELGASGAEALARIRTRRPGALYNEAFANYLASIGAAVTPR